jgi:glutamine synthetase
VIPANITSHERDLVLGSIIDMAGVARGKAVPAGRLDAFTDPGLGASPSWNVFCLDDAIAFTPKFSATGDLRLRIDASEQRNLGDGTWWAPASIYDQQGNPAPVCSRRALGSLVDELRTDGLEAVVGHEIEFTLFDAVPAEEWAAYGLGAAQTLEAFIKDLLAAAARADLAIDQLHAEYGHNQLEISLAPAAPVEAVDAMVLARILISRTARLHRLRASFSPFPEKDGAGNGAHQHVSFTRTGRPVLSGGDGPNGLTAEGAAAIAGLVASLPDFMAVLASSPLSHLRLQPGLWSGAYCCWGLENREAAVRFCAATPGNPNGANIEIKVVDPSANPYLSSAVILGMAGAGMRAGLPLPAEVSVDPAGLSEQDRRAAGVRLLPSAVPEMLKRLQAAPLAQHILGEDIIEALTAVKSHDHSRFDGLPAEAVAAQLRYRWTI